MIFTMPADQMPIWLQIFYMALLIILIVFGIIGAATQRKQLAAVLTRRALEKAVERARAQEAKP